MSPKMLSYHRWTGQPGLTKTYSYVLSVTIKSDQLESLQLTVADWQAQVRALMDSYLDPDLYEQVGPNVFAAYGLPDPYEGLSHLLDRPAQYQATGTLTGCMHEFALLFLELARQLPGTEASTSQSFHNEWGGWSDYRLDQTGQVTYTHYGLVSETCLDHDQAVDLLTYKESQTIPIEATGLTLAQVSDPDWLAQQAQRAFHAVGPVQIVQWLTMGDPDYRARYFGIFIVHESELARTGQSLAEWQQAVRQLLVRHLGQQPENISQLQPCQSIQPDHYAYMVEGQFVGGYMHEPLAALLEAQQQLPKTRSRFRVALRWGTWAVYELRKDGQLYYLQYGPIKTYPVRWDTLDQLPLPGARIKLSFGS